MRSLESIHFCKIVKLMVGGGTKVLRLVLEDASAPATFKEYLYQHQAEVFELKLTEDQKALIINRDVEKMDITLLHRLIMKLFKDKLTQTQRKLVNELKTERDNLVHSDLLETAQLNGPDFAKRWDDIETILLKLPDTIRIAGVKQVMKEFINRIWDSVPDIDEICETLTEWCRSSPDTEHNIDKIDEMLEQLRADYERDKLSWPFRLFHIDYTRYKRSLETPDHLDAEVKDTALDHIMKDNIVVLQGQKGIGKTKGAFSVAHTLTLSDVIKTERCAEIKNPSAVKDVCPNDLDLLIIDGIGNNPKMTPVWEESLRYLESLLGNSSMKIIITTRDPINLEFRTAKGRFKLTSKTVKFLDLETWPD